MDNGIQKCQTRNIWDQVKYMLPFLNYYFSSWRLIKCIYLYQVRSQAFPWIERIHQSSKVVKRLYNVTVLKSGAQRWMILQIVRKGSYCECGFDMLYLVLLYLFQCLPSLSLRVIITFAPISKFCDVFFQEMREHKPFTRFYNLYSVFLFADWPS